MTDTPAQPDFQDPVISIGTLAQKVGLSVSAVRKYENEGLVLAHRTESGHRLFSHEDIQRVRYLQHLIQDVGFNVAGIRRMLALLPCWDLLPCRPEMHRTCPAYEERTRPCWMIKGLPCPPRGNECRRCAVYRFGSMCVEDLKRLLHGQNELQTAGAAIKELLLQKKHASEEEH